MDTDIKNLFQRAGSQLSGYKEINRLQENEQAKQRWPLLRDIRIEQIPDQLDAGEEEKEPAPIFEQLGSGGERYREQESFLSAGLHAKHGAAQDEVHQLRPFIAGKPAGAYSAPAAVLSPAERIAEPLETKAVEVKQAELATVEKINPEAQEEVSHLLSAVLGKQEEVEVEKTADAIDTTDKTKPLSELFRRLAEEPVEQNIPSPSFFRKMFGS